jgi:hypothetical protein
VGDQQGRIWVLDASSGAVTRTWAAHVFPVRSIAAAGPLVYSLGRDGGIRAWPALAPPVELTAAWRADTQDCLQQQQLKVRPLRQCEVLRDVVGVDGSNRCCTLATAHLRGVSVLECSLFTSATLYCAPHLTLPLLLSTLLCTHVCACGCCCSQVGACTWNVNENKPSRPGLELWLGERVRDAHLVLIGLQVSVVCTVRQRLVNSAACCWEWAPVGLEGL